MKKILGYVFMSVLLFGLATDILGEDVVPKRDPTKPFMTEKAIEPTKKAMTKEMYVLSAIIVSRNRRLALINSKFVKVGDAIGEASVVQINRNSVLLAVPGQKMTIYLISDKGWE